MNKSLSRGPGLILPNTRISTDSQRKSLLQSIRNIESMASWPLDSYYKFSNNDAPFYYNPTTSDILEAEDVANCMGPHAVKEDLAKNLGRLFSQGKMLSWFHIYLINHRQYLKVGSAWVRWDGIDSINGKVSNINVSYYELGWASATKVSATIAIEYSSAKGWTYQNKQADFAGSKVQPSKEIAQISNSWRSSVKIMVDNLEGLIKTGSFEMDFTVLRRCTAKMSDGTWREIPVEDLSLMPIAKLNNKLQHLRDWLINSGNLCVIDPTNISLKDLMDVFSTFDKFLIPEAWVTEESKETNLHLSNSKPRYSSLIFVLLLDKLDKKVLDRTGRWREYKRIAFVHRSCYSELLPISTPYEEYKPVRDEKNGEEKNGEEKNGGISHQEIQELEDGDWVVY